MSTLEFKLTLNTPPEAAWRAWTDHNEITNWFSPEAYIEPRLGGPYELYFETSNQDHQSTKGCKIIEIKPMTNLGFQWKGPDAYRETMNTPAPITYVHVTFKPDGEKTLLTVSHGGWGKGEKWEEAKAWHVKAWEGVLAGLEKHLDNR